MYDYSNHVDIIAETTPTHRVYHTPDGSYPSITTILGKTANNAWLQKWIDKVGQEEASRISKEATDRGTLIHKYLERYWEKEDVFPDLLKEESDVQQMTRNLITATQNNVTKVYAQEIALWNNSLKYAGRVDMVGEWRGQACIIDFKTSKKRKYVSQIRDYFIQCAAYAEAHNERFGSNLEKLVILITVENSNVQAFYGLRSHYIPDLQYRAAQYHKARN